MRSLRSAGAMSATALMLVSFAAAAPVRVSPMQPWISADGDVRLLRPLIAPPGRSTAPLGSLMSSGWRLVWDGSAMGHGQLVVRLALKVVPAGRPGPMTDVLQVGRSRDPAVVRQCLSYGLRTGSTRRLPDRTINGQRYSQWLSGDAGMSQSITATDLRTVIGGTCYAIARFRYGESASDGDPSIRLSAARGAAMLDASLASLQLGRVQTPPAMRPHAVTLRN